MSDQVVLPFGGRTHPNSGHAGSETSRARAETADADGTTKDRQRKMLHALHDAGPDGLTWKEADTILGWNHHGNTTGALSTLHKAHRIARLGAVRNRCKVYVLLQWVGSRPTEPYGNTATNARLDQAAELFHALVIQHDCGHGPIPDAMCRTCEAKSWLRWYDNLRGGT